MVKTETQQQVDSSSVLKELSGSGWQVFDPPTVEQERSDESVIGNFKGKPIRAGFKMETVESSDTKVHEIYRTGQYDVHLKIESIGDGLAHGQVKVEKAEGYD